MTEPPPSPQNARDPNGPPDPSVAEEPAFAERCGERILTFVEKFLPDKAPGITRSDAVVSGFGSAVGRVILGAALIAVCIGVAMLWDWGARRIGRLLPDRIEDFGESIRGFGALILWVIAAGGVLIFCFADAEKKGRLLSWCCFVLVAAGAMGGAAPFLPVVALLTGQFAMHYFVHCALNRRDRETERLLLAERDAVRAERNVPPKLLHRYAGLRGFDEENAEGGESQP